ncbi:hypothetical protein [Burkholderia stagnalis]
MEGDSLYVVKDLLAHSSISVTERYAHLSPDQRRAAVQRLLPLQRGRPDCRNVANLLT